jgi:hypothetical protein
MAQHDYVIANGTGAAVRSDLNNALAAIVSQNSGATEPATMYAYQWWADTTTNLLKLRNAANSGWITLFQLDGEWSTIALENGTAGAPSIYFKDSGTDTGFYSPGANQVGISTGGTARLTIDSNGNVDIDSNTLYVDAANNRVGLGTSTPSRNLTVYNTASNPFISIESSNTGSPGLLFGDTDNNAIGQIRYDHSTDKMQFSVNGSERAVIDSSGRVGIGTTSPGAPLSFADVNALKIQFNGNAANFYGISKLAGGGSLGDGEYRFTAGDVTAGAFTFKSGASERVRIDSSGRLLVGTSSAKTNFENSSTTPQFQIESTSLNGASLSILRDNNDSGGPKLFLAHGRTDAGLVSNNDELGGLFFSGGDGSEFVSGASITAAVDGTPGADDMPSRLVFSTTADGASSPTERMRITNGGTVGIGSSGPAAWVSSRQVIQMGRGAAACDTAVSNGGSTIFSNNFYYDGADKAIATGYSQGIVFNPTNAGTTQIVSTSGTNTGGNTITFTGGPYVSAGGTSWTSSSDERLKDIIEPLSNGLEKVASIRAVKFSWKDDPNQTTNVGVIAQDVEAVLPEIVSKTQRYGSDDQTEYLGVSYDLLAPLLIAALQEAKDKIETLEAKVAALEAA